MIKTFGEINKNVTVHFRLNIWLCVEYLTSMHEAMSSNRIYCMKFFYQLEKSKTKKMEKENQVCISHGGTSTWLLGNGHLKVPLKKIKHPVNAC